MQEGRVDRQITGDVVAQLVQRRPRNPVDSMTRGSNSMRITRKICESFSLRDEVEGLKKENKGQCREEE